MTLALRRFHLDGIGPPAARFDPLTVDLAHAEDAERAARTALLFLENGGGKSVLLRLLFAVVLPGRRSTVGGGRLEGYVGSGDTGHVVLEWDTPDGRRLVTGTVLEWRNRTRSAAAANLLQLWYSFVPAAGTLSMESLPIREGDRRVTRSGFRERLAALAREHPTLELVVEDGPAAWADHLLRATPLDPEIFRYQRQMNADEADAESLFAGLRTDDDFVRFVLEAIHDPDELGEFGELVSGYAGQLGRREQLEVERRFCERAASCLRPLGDAVVSWRSAEASLTAATQAAQSLRRRLDARARRDREAAAAEESAARAADEAAMALDRQAKRTSEIASELRRLEAEFRLQDAKVAEDAADKELGRARLATAGWRLVPIVIEANELEARRGALQKAQEAAERALEPLRLRAEAAAARYGGRLSSVAEGLDRVGRESSALASACDALAGERDAAAGGARELAGSARANAAGLRVRIEEAQVQLAVLRDPAAGLIGPAEEPAAALSRWRDDVARVETRLESALSRRRHLDEQAGQLGAEVVHLGGAEAQLAATATTARGELDAHRATAKALVGETRVQALVPGATDAWVVAEVLEERLDARVRADEAESRRLRNELDRIQQNLEAIGVDGLLPPHSDVQRVREALVEAGIGAASGWTYLATNLDAAGRARVLATNPAAAGGVLVSDPSRLAEAQRVVAEAGVETETVVVIGTSSHLTEIAPGSAAPVRAALYDPEWSQRTRLGLEEEAVEVTYRLEELTAALTRDEPLLHGVRAFRRSCPLARRDALDLRTGQLDAELAGIRSRLGEAEGRRAEAAAAIALLAADDPALRRGLEEAGDRLRRVAAMAEDWSRVAGWTEQVAALELEAGRARADSEALAADAAHKRTEAEQARRTATDRSREAVALRNEVVELGVEPGPPPTEISTDVLRAELHAGRDVYEAERAGRDLTPELESTERALRARRLELSAVPAEVRAEAMHLAPAAAALDEGARRERLAAAELGASRCEEVRRSATVERGRAEELLKSRMPPDRPRHTVLDGADAPGDASVAARWAAERQAEFLALTRQVRERQAEAAERRRDSQRSETHATLVAGGLILLPEPESDPQGGDDVEPWPGQAEEAAGAANAVRAQLDHARGEASQWERALERSGHAVRATAAEAAVASMGGIRLALAEESLDTLAPRALELADELDGMRSSVEAELADVLRHRDGIVVRLATLVDTNLRHLGRLAKLSTMPPGLGEWSGRPFLAVDFEVAPPGDIPARLGPVVDAAAAEPKKRQPVALLLAATRAAVARPDGDGERTFRVRLLRPNRTMQVQWAGVAELEREFSGGMKLTAAICTYCALAALRANSRSTGRLFGHEPGPLFLDNPVGKASADFLLDLQHAVAEKLGVQLVHTTGVWDVEALATYERVVRLRNLADLRRNVHRLRVDDDLPSFLPAGGTGVDAVSFSLRRDAG